jgi:hypothetical protein
MVLHGIQGLADALNVFGRAEGLENEFEARELDRFGDKVVHASFVAAFNVRFI